jgi:hypothetical protein
MPEKKEKEQEDKTAGHLTIDRGFDSENYQGFRI